MSDPVVPVYNPPYGPCLHLRVNANGMCLACWDRLMAARPDIAAELEPKPVL